MSLFLKIFLWFWLTLALIVGAILLINWSTSSEPLARQWETFVGESVSNNGDTSAQIFEAEGKDGLETYFTRVRTLRRIAGVAFYDAKGSQIAGDSIAGSKELIDKAKTTNNPEFDRNKERILAAKRVVGKSGSAYLYVVELRRFQPPPFFTNRLLLQILSVILIGGLVCYALATYLTSPITKLRGATRQFAEGHFETRVRDKVGNRRDELSALAGDFDEMAERIENLINAEKRMAQDISHELRSPLARMNVALELARSKANADIFPLLGRLESESQKLNDLIGQLLTLSRLESGAEPFEKTEINLSKLLSELVSDADFEAKSIGRGVEIEKSEDVRVFGNENLIRSAIENVLRNASRYTPKDTSVKVNLVRDRDRAVLTIRDYGEGVPDEELNKLFKPFYRVSTSRDRKSGGIGLGLAIAERAVSNHHGNISAKNTGDGLVVTISLPSLA
ncbi:MAG: ATP-binding protein [Pyrinomonadaceae bacterium]